MDLNGKWKYICDAASTMEFGTVCTMAAGNECTGEMNIPSNWQLEGLDNFNGTVWFIREFEYKPEIKDWRALFLNFGGVDYYCQVWLNDCYLGNHEGYFQEFRFRIDKAFRETGTNRLIVKVTSPLEEPGSVWPLRKKLIKGIFSHHDCRPGAWDMQYGQDKNTGGIWNTVSLDAAGRLMYSDIRINSRILDTGNIARVVMSFSYENFSDEAVEENVSVKIISPKGDIAFSGAFMCGFHSGVGTQTIALDLKDPQPWNTWDLGEPNMYMSEITSSSAGTYHTSFGIREVHMDESGSFFLNGKKLFLRGTNIIPEQFLSTLSHDRIKRIADLIRGANINAVRIHAHVNRKEVYEEFDRQGIILWQDFSLQWTYDDSPGFSANACSQIKDMVSQLYNHPSIAFWCCHNEPGEQIRMLDPFLRDAVLNEDSTRIVRLASNYEEHAYDGWYWGSMEHYAAAPMGPLVTEFGAQALPARESLQKFLTEDELKRPDWKKWAYHDFQYEQTFHIAKVKRGNSVDEFIENSQQYQADYIRTAVDFYRRRKNDGITGVFHFMFIDCWPSITWSVVDYFQEPKKGYHALGDVFRPLYLSVKLRQKEYLPESFLNTDLWIINDLYKVYLDSYVAVKLDGQLLGKLDNINIKENSVEFFYWEKMKFGLPENIAAGKHTLRFELYDAGDTMISDNEMEIVIIKHA